MKRFCAIFFRIVLVWAVSTGVIYAQGTTITLVHVNDTHSHLDAIGPRGASLQGTLGGISRAAAVIGSLRAAEPNMLLLHAGDVFQGDLFFNAYFGVPEFMFMKEMGFDAMAVGNHEFDFGPGVFTDALTAAFAGGSFPLISANLDLSAFPPLQPFIRPAIDKTFGATKVAIFGLTVPNNPTNMPAPVVISEAIVEIAQATSDSLRAEGADVVILLSHLGIYLDRIVASSVTGIDLIVGGHDHYLFKEPVEVVNPGGKTVRIFQAGEHYRYVGKLTFTVDGGNIAFDDYSMIDVDASVPQVPEVQAVVEDLKAGIEAQFGPMYRTVIARAPAELGKRYDERLPLRDTPMGNLVTDAYRTRTGTDLAITALGLISEKLSEGPILGADLFRSLSYGFDEATGFGFKMATFDITGAELARGMEIGLSQLEIGDDFFLQYSGLRFSYVPAKPVGERVDLASIRVNGKKWSPFSMYSVTVNAGIAMLLGSLGVSVEDLEFRDELEYDVVREYLAAMGTVVSNPQGRVMEHAGKSDAAVEAAVRKAVSSVSAYPNPFNPSTTLSVTLASQGRVTVSMYNALGQEVARLADGEYDAGTHEFRWEAAGMPAGIYFCRVSGSDFQTPVKVLLVK
ncbi:MAG TPA: 5'-nucleotidase C-terminal domain-containing protein [Bacteroidota bacterium]|nr:5'-nucleotidase C-terminal domain-containing protein [Bacteroidota bacterium]